MNEILGVVSSYGYVCGNATYAEKLCRSVEQRGKIAVKRIAIPRSLTKAKDPRNWQEMITEIRECTMVNIQWELGAVR